MSLHHEFFLMQTGLDRIPVKSGFEVGCRIETPTWKPAGQWWERRGYVLLLHPAIDPNDDLYFTGWVKVTEDRARAVLEAQPK